jgi:hypothetical protein
MDGSAGVDEWLAVLDELLVRPFPEPPEDPIHHVTLAESEDFFDDVFYVRYEKVAKQFEADRERLAAAVTARYGPPERKDLTPYYSRWSGEPGEALFNYLTLWIFEIDLWRVGDRGVVVEVGQQDKELPLELMIVVGDLTHERRAGLNHPATPLPRLELPRIEWPAHRHVFRFGLT